ncbi:MAG: hypothetical protein KJN93_06480 [Alphaproteobacteria bacterium]|nr:hypothetical protein [Alphaproteobacteria bacterium]NNF23744.1 hypothetical protein [Paracoccaceae bacterium]
MLRLVVPIVGAVVIGVPVVLLNLSVLGKQAEVETLITGETAVPTVLAEVGQELNKAIRNVSEEQKIKETFNKEEHNFSRLILIDQWFDIADVLKEGEPAPDESLHLLYATARAPQLLMRECPLMLETLARSCVTANADVAELSDGGFAVSGAMSYIPAEDLGEISLKGRVTKYEQELRIPEKGATRIEPADLEQAKRDVYESALAACDRIREKHGNCVIERIFVSYRSFSPTAPAQFHARIKMVWVGPEGLDQRSAKVDLAGVTQFAAVASTGGGILGGFSLSQIFGGDKSEKKKGPVILRGGGAYKNKSGRSGGRWLTPRKR